MANYKIYISGNNIEIYEYENVPIVDMSYMDKYREMQVLYKQMQIQFKKHIKLIDRVKAFEEKTGIACGDILQKIRVENYEDIQRFVKLDKYFKLKKEMEKISYESEEIDLKKKRRLQTLRDNGNGLKRMVREHFSDKSVMLTLTYDEKYKCSPDEIDKSDRRTKAMWKKLKDDGFEPKYVGVRELQKKRNVIHYHYILDSEKLFEMYELYSAGIENKRKTDGHKAFEQWFMKKYWKFGFVDIRHIEGIDDTGAYLAKYLTKGDLKNMEWLENRRLVLRSQGIKKIEPIAEGSTVEKVIKNLNTIMSIAQQNIFNQLERKQIFYNSYQSQYVGKVSYFEIHVNRLTNEQLDLLEDLI
ncbi:MAG: hypothetical protein H9W82_12325 [Lactobacillus sp.]|nr:hypothetical protein [Lactobacillus sp.]